MASPRKGKVQDLTNRWINKAEAIMVISQFIQYLVCGMQCLGIYFFMFFQKSYVDQEDQLKNFHDTIICKVDKS